jgi:hypothetical protein
MIGPGWTVLYVLRDYAPDNPIGDRLLNRPVQQMTSIDPSCLIDTERYSLDEQFSVDGQLFIVRTRADLFLGPGPLR